MGRREPRFQVFLMTTPIKQQSIPKPTRQSGRRSLDCNSHASRAAPRASGLLDRGDCRIRSICEGAQIEGGKISPNLEDLPENWFRGLLTWYRDWSAQAAGRPAADDPLLALRGSGKKLWANEHADDYVRRLREGWE